MKPVEDAALATAINKLRTKHKRSGYRGVWIRLRRAGWPVNRKRVHGIWKAEGWQIRTRKRKRRTTGSSANSCAERRAEYRGHVWSYDFVLDRTGGLLKFLPILDEYTREVHAIEVGRSFRGKDVATVLLHLFRVHGEPAYLRSDNGSEFLAQAVQEELAKAGVGTLFIAPGSPWENGYSESFNSRFRDEFLDRELFTSTREAAVLAEQFRVDYNVERPHMSLGYLTPAEFAARSLPRALLPRCAGEASDSPGVREVF